MSPATAQPTNIPTGSDTGSDYVPSYYLASANPLPEAPALQGRVEADVCVIGAGYTGLSAALHLAQRGSSVVVLEANRVAWGASGRNGGHVGVGQRVRQEELRKKHGDRIAGQLWDLGLEAVALVKELIDHHRIECDLKHGILHVAAKPGHAEELRHEAVRLRKWYGYDRARYVEPDEVGAMLGSRPYHGGLLDGGSLHLHPLNYALGIADAAIGAGARIHQYSRVTRYDEGETIEVHTAAGTVRARHLLIACNGYLDKLEPRVAGKIMPINNFVLATEPLGEQKARELIRDDVAVQDSLFVINYWRLSVDNRLVFGGGENYTRSFPKDMKSFVRKYMLRVYPQLGSTRIDYAWGGTLAITLNRMPHVGRLGNNVYFAQGYSGHGVPTATLAGKLVAEAIHGSTARFDVLAQLPPPTFPGGTWLRRPGLIAGMLYYKMLDSL